MNRLNSQNVLPRVEIKVHFQTGHRGRRLLKRGEKERQLAGKREDLPRLTKLLALAHRWNRLIEDGTVANYAEIARMMEAKPGPISDTSKITTNSDGIE